MPSKDPEIRRATWNKWYKKNKAIHHKRSKDWTDRRRKELRILINKYKSTHPCNNCGFTNPVALDFHHIDVLQKDIEVSIAINRTWSNKRLEKEIAKCIVLCSNCHRIEHNK